ncbi:MAG TPA: adenosine kinase [Prevotellaceae bacterium]|nr:adenosine kinase [Prevotellaceae bacterium]HBE54677.1 adenosine kinase [Prevotellaceae bacterium]
MKIAGIGNALVDVLVHLQDDTLLGKAGLPRGGMLLIDDTRREFLSQLMRPLHPRKSAGGSAGNTIKALAALGGDCLFVGKVGDDDDAALLSGTYRSLGAGVRFLRSSLHTGVASTFISPTGERTFGTCLGAASTLRADEITGVLLEGVGWLHIEGYLVQNHALIDRIGQIARQMGIPTSMDLASYNVLAEDVAFARHLVSEYVDVVFANEDESRVFTNGKSPMDALAEMAGMCRMAVVKMGADGAAARSGGQEATVKGGRARVADTTGAGDFFAAGFLYAHTHGGSMDQSLRCGAALGEQAVQVVGTDLDRQTWAACRARVSKILGQ